MVTGTMKTVGGSEKILKDRKRIEAGTAGLRVELVVNHATVKIGRTNAVDRWHNFVGHGLDCLLPSH